MLSRTAQIVIGIGLLIITAAFLLIGLNFAALQGTFFQNGIMSIEMFSNNVAAAYNSVYTAPSSMTVTLNGNTSICQWAPAIDAYTCAGGSKIYNVSYASGPTLDVGNNFFSVALCVMIGYMPFGASVGSEVSDSAKSAGDIVGIDSLGTGVSESTANSIAEGNLLRSSQMISGQQFTEFEQNIRNAFELFDKIEEDPSILDELTSQESTEVETVAEEVPTSLSEVVESPQDFAVSVPNFLKTGVRRILINLGVPALTFGLVNVYYYFSNTIPSVLNGIKSDPYLSNIAKIESESLISTYNTGGPILAKTLAAYNLISQQISQDQALEQLVSLPNSIEGQQALAVFSNSISTQSQILNEVANISSSYGVYSTPTNGVNSPRTLSASNSFMSYKISYPGDFPLSTVAFIGSTSFMVYARTASCLGNYQYSFSSVGNSVQSVISGFGALTTYLNVFSKLNQVAKLGTYFVGYGSEVYVNGQYNSLPTQVEVPVITDLSDICEVAQTTYKPGVPLNIELQPSGNGSISISISQGLFNTLCGKGSPIYPKSFSSLLNQILSTTNTKQISYLLPPQYSIGLIGDNNSELCLFRNNILPTGNPWLIGQNLDYNGQSNYYPMIFASPVMCINMSEITNSEYQLNVRPVSSSDLLDGNVIFINNNDTLGFSIPLNAYPNDYMDANLFDPNVPANFVGSGTVSIKPEAGIDSPLYNGVLGKLLSLTHNLPDRLSAILSKSFNFNFLTPNQAFYQTLYTNVTFTVSRSGNNYNIQFDSNKIVFGIYPNNLDQLGGTYTQG